MIILCKIDSRSAHFIFSFGSLIQKSKSRRKQNWEKKFFEMLNALNERTNNDDSFITLVCFRFSLFFHIFFRRFFIRLFFIEKIFLIRLILSTIFVSVSIQFVVSFSVSVLFRVICFLKFIGDSACPWL